MYMVIYMNNEKIKELSGANMDIDLTTDSSIIDWKQESCPWNKEENTTVHKCCIKNKKLDNLLKRYPASLSFINRVFCAFRIQYKHGLFANFLQIVRINV